MDDLFDFPEIPQPRKSKLPPPFVWTNDFTDFPKPPEAMIEGILRKGHKMLLAGPSKVGKSYLLQELCVAVADGREWLGFKCRKSKVAYVNLEIDKYSCLNRVREIYAAMGSKLETEGNLVIWSLTGHTAPLDEMCDDLIHDIRENGYELVVLDPAYKILMGDENNATEMSRFFGELDKICKETGAAVILCHHHSKGYQANKRSMDRASGSGVFARDPDAILDLLEVPSKNQGGEENNTVLRLEFSLREFAAPKPFNIVFRYPLHYRQTETEEQDAADEGEPVEIKMRKNGPEARKKELDEAYEKRYKGCPVKREDLAEEMHVDVKTVLKRVRENPTEYSELLGCIVRLKDLQDQQSISSLIQDDPADYPSKSALG